MLYKWLSGFFFCSKLVKPMILLISEYWTWLLISKLIYVKSTTITGSKPCIFIVVERVVVKRKILNHRSSLSRIFFYCSCSHLIQKHVYQYSNIATALNWKKRNIQGKYFALLGKNASLSKHCILNIFPNHL